MVLSFVDAIFTALFFAALAYAIGPVVIEQDNSYLNYLYYSFILVVLRFLLKVVMAKINASMSYQIEKQIREHLVDKLIKVGPLSLARSAKLPSVFVDAVDEIVPYFTHYLTSVRYAMSIPVVLLIAVFVASPLQGFILLILCPLIPLFMVLIGKKAERLNQRQWLQITRLSAHFQEAMRRLVVIKLFNLKKHEINKIYLLNKRWRVETMQVLKVAFFSALALEFFATVGVAFCAVTLGFAVYDYGFNYTLALFILLCAPEFFLPLRTLGQNYHARMKALGAASTMVELLNSQDKLAYSDNLKNSTCDLNKVLSEGVAIKFEDVKAVYADGRIGIEHKSYAFKPNKITALVGPSGSGKTTTLMLCAALLEKSAGRILINEHDIESLDIKSLRKHITYIPQNPYLFYGTIRSNLDLYNDNIQDEVLIEALKKVGANDLIERFEDGLEHKILDDNSGISGGEARLIALARALINNSKIILLDEPTASLDKDTQAAFIQALLNIADNKTVIMAAHRQELIDVADEIVNL